MKGERHDAERLSPELVEQIRQLSQVGKGREYISKKLGLAWRTLDRATQIHGLVYKRYRRTDDQIQAVIECYGGLDELIVMLKRMRGEGMGVAARIG